ncbi:Myosin-8 [Labeo rohita]|uniref:Myosin-8 n=1 Tax=Labeo rohita TaxID=84645 RepID=A0ABQ8L699_LABRO|nr:Myosin-8 [Labeo rohita]
MTSITSSSSQWTETSVKVSMSDLTTENFHDYLRQDNEPKEFTLAEEGFPCLSETPCKSPAPKQRRIVDKDTTVILSHISDLSRLVRNRSDALEKLVERNSRVINEIKEEVCVNRKQITELKETIEYICADVTAMKTRLKQAEKECRGARETSIIAGGLFPQMEFKNSGASREKWRRCP